MKEQDKDIPAWMTATTESVVIELSIPSMLNGVLADKMTLRYPKLSDMRACKAAHPSDEDAHDLMLFASLAQVGSKDLLGLSVRDYNRVSSGYFRLVTED